eukprot:gnl/MRDRNA2_/MRDRNA2_34735_c0_seq1.p1 gnl/MRDRNA2_/MRDRNA2_34735_c0~~gnl/MRDRNA2_/MRDRNA2_34735_c0_seq1.p1  ORF type:complete len:670 (-),score=80.94 gnl/MRDRNA2_/MRDRNA2_34735_c0_seq1:65-2074(-)
MLIAPPRSWVFQDSAVVRNSVVSPPMTSSMRGAWVAPQAHKACIFRAPKTTSTSTDRCHRAGMTLGAASWAPPVKTASSQLPVRKPLQPLNFSRDGAAAPPCGGGSCRVSPRASPRASPTVTPRQSPAASPAPTPRETLFGSHSVCRGRSAPASGAFDTDVMTAGSRCCSIDSREGSPAPSPCSSFRDVHVRVAPPRDRSREQRADTWKTFSYHNVCDIDRTCKKGLRGSPNPGQVASTPDLRNFFVREDACQRDLASLQRGRIPRARSQGRSGSRPKYTPRASPSPSPRSRSPSSRESPNRSPSQLQVNRTHSMSHLHRSSDRSTSSSCRNRSASSSCRKKRAAPGDILAALRRSSSAATTAPTQASLTSSHISSVDYDSKSSYSLEVTSSETSPVTRDFEGAFMEDDDLLVEEVTSALIAVAPPRTSSVGLETIEEGCGSVEHGGGHYSARDSLGFDSLCYSVESEAQSIEPQGQTDNVPLVAPLYGAPWLHKQGSQASSKAISGSVEPEVILDRCILPKSAMQRIRTWLHTAKPGNVMTAPGSGPSSPRLAPSAEGTPLSTPRDANTTLHCISPGSISASGSEQNDSALQLGLEPISEVLQEEMENQEGANSVSRAFRELAAPNCVSRRPSGDDKANAVHSGNKLRKTPRTPRSKKENEPGHAGLQ